MSHQAPGSSSNHPLPRVALIAARTEPAITRSRADNHASSLVPSRTPTVATVEEVPEPVLEPTPSSDTRAAAVGDATLIGTNVGNPDELLNATAVRAICVRNDTDLENRLTSLIQAQLGELRTEVRDRQAHNDALQGDVQTLRQDMNRLLEQVHALKPAKYVSPRQETDPNPVDVAAELHTQTRVAEDIVPIYRVVQPIREKNNPQDAEVSALTELMDRWSRLEKAQSENDNADNGASALSKKEKSKKSKARRHKRRKEKFSSSSSEDEYSSSSSSESSSSDTGSKKHRRLRRKRDRGVKAFRYRGPKHGDLRPIKATNPLYKELLSYRHYRLEKTSCRRNSDTTKARQQVKNMGLTMLPHLFTAEDPIILDFLRRFVGEAEQLGMSEEQAYIALPFFLKGQAKHHFEAVKDTTLEGEGGVTCWSEAVQYLLRSYATANAIRSSILSLKDVRQQAGEDEKTYSARLAKAEVRCGNIHMQDEKKTLFIDGLTSAIKATVSRHRETHDEETYLELLQHAQAEGDTYRARAREGRRTSTPLVASAKTPKAVKPAPQRPVRGDRALFADPFDGLQDPLMYASQGDDPDAMLFMGDYENETLASIPTTDLPSTEVREGDPILAFGSVGNRNGMSQRRVSPIKAVRRRRRNAQDGMHLVAQPQVRLVPEGLRLSVIPAMT